MKLNSAALYGESIFTSFRSYDRAIPFFEEHLQRLFKGVNDFYFNHRLKFEEFKSFFELESFLNQIKPDHYYRLTVYSPQIEFNKAPNLSLSDLILDIQIKPIATELEAISLELAPSPFSKYKAQIKSGSYFQNIYFKRKARLHGFDDVLFFSSESITELSSSNLLLKRDGQFYSPLDPSIFYGLTLKGFESFLEASSNRLQYTEIKKESLASFDEVYALNSVRGICAVDRIDNIEYINNKNTQREFIKYLGQL